MGGSANNPRPVMNQDNSSSVYLPAGTWYEFNSTSAHTDTPKNISMTSAALGAVPAYVKAGSIVPLAPVVQYSDQLPGGALEVQVYSGSDAEFVMVEDDGETEAYIKAGGARRTTYRWSEQAAELSWSVDGTFSNANTFKQVKLVVFADGQRHESSITAIGTSGSLKI